MKVAITSQNLRTVTAHAGRAHRFLIYDIRCPCAPQEIEPLDLPEEMAFHSFHGGRHPIDGVTAIITGSAQDDFVSHMAQRGIEVVCSAEENPLQAVHDYIQGIVKPPKVFVRKRA
ncbi:NifB/NifX family molybdenum-iron cluster-binding protein [Thauera sp. SDU_THAU2]|uniref:NifB/NifX family molybdenum-iron cluster-binding protein n=1 Tax=Thauera sp. SDU_THAU2 TaxID=3136633 RepID=UPI0031204CAC